MLLLKKFQYFTIKLKQYLSDINAQMQYNSSCSPTLLYELKSKDTKMKIKSFIKTVKIK